MHGCNLELCSRCHAKNKFAGSHMVKLFTVPPLHRPVRYMGTLSWWCWIGEYSLLCVLTSMILAYYSGWSFSHYPSQEVIWALQPENLSSASNSLIWRVSLLKNIVNFRLPDILPLESYCSSSGFRFLDEIAHFVGHDFSAHGMQVTSVVASPLDSLESDLLSIVK